ncbi:MAG TPA: hypothetical protein DGG95_17710 [Cytophagales bacterium]|jgi:hypothetical protein|nr:hypothetical protein [Cytophagales bacterium]
MPAMKLKIVVILCLLSTTENFSQSAKDVFDPNVPITWLGIDFTGAVFNGDREKLGSEADMKNLMSSLNRLTMNERDKFNFGAMLQKNKIDYSIDVAIGHNEKMDFSNGYSDKLGHILHEQDIDAIVRDYDYGDLKGVGLIFNVETLSKFNEEAFVWITFIDIEHKQIIFTERMMGKPAGFGLRNYWAGALYKIMKSVGVKDFDRWKRKYNH